jgi:hypothetical protein
MPSDGSGPLMDGRGSPNRADSGDARPVKMPQGGVYKTGCIQSPSVYNRPAFSFQRPSEGHADHAPECAASTRSFPFDRRSGRGSAGLACGCCWSCEGPKPISRLRSARSRTLTPCCAGVTDARASSMGDVPNEPRRAARMQRTGVKDLVPRRPEAQNRSCARDRASPSFGGSASSSQGLASASRG